MKHKLSLLLFIIPIVASFGGVDDFDDGVLNETLWSIWDPTNSEKSTIIEENGKINFVFTGLDGYEGGFIGLRYQEAVNNLNRFSITLDIDHNIVTNGINLGIALEPVAGGGLLFFDLFGNSNFRIYVDDRNGTWLEDGPGVSGGLVSTLKIDYDNEQSFFNFSAEEGGTELFSESVGIGSIMGTIGLIDWGMNPSDTFRVSLYSESFGGVNSISGELTMDNFTLVAIPEPKMTVVLCSLFVGLSVAVYKRRSRTSRWR